MANAPVAYDLTHLVSRLMSRKPSGIDQIDLAYARHFLAPGRAPLASGVKYGLSAGRVLDNAAANSALAAADRTWRVAKSAASAGTPGSRLAAHVAHLRHRAARTRGATIPEGAV
ncbi:MAG: hypothetical protein KGI57_07910, partial [Hyphomicrobiales bacterium]|nr:hypothetical protein [Hyphomicrobiales bacterium]